MDACAETKEMEFSEEQIMKWKEEMQARRTELFHRNWKNRRYVPQLKSRSQENDFKFVLEWHEESGEIISRDKERNRLDTLIHHGLDVNAPENRPQT